MAVNLTSGCIEEMVSGEHDDSQPIVIQVMNLKKIAGQGQSDRYRLLVNDGITNYSHVMLATQLNAMMDNNEIDTHAVIRVNRYLRNTVQGDKKILILLDVTVLKKGSEVKEKLGPSYAHKGGSAGAPAQSAAPPARAAQDAPAQGRVPLNPSRSLNGNTSKPSPANVTPPPKANSFGGRGSAPAAPGTPTRVHKINTLTPYQNRWRIRARVSQKSSIRTWNNSKGEGSLFSVNLLDDSGEIRATAFKDEVTKFYDLLEVGKVYYISRCSLKTANKQFNNTNNDYEMTFNRDSVVERCDDEVDDIPSITFNFVPINEMEKHQANSMIDVIGVVKECHDVVTFVAKTSQKEMTKRDVQMVDQSGVAINLTLWGTEATQFDGSNNPVLAVKGAKLSDFGGRSLSVLGSSQMIVNPDIREAHVLRGWFDREGNSMDFSTFRSEGPAGGSAASWKTFGQVVSENLGHGEKPDYFTTKAFVIHCKKENCMYAACPSESCNKKVVDQGNGMWRCEKCNREFPTHKWRMILSSNLADFSGTQWVTSFQESAEAMLGISADELGALRSNDETAFEKVFQQAMFKEYIFRMRSKVETYNEESRLKTAVITATPIDYVQYGKHLIEELAKLGI